MSLFYYLSVFLTLTHFKYLLTGHLKMNLAQNATSSCIFYIFVLITIYRIMEQFRKHLTAHDIKPSLQRMMIYEYLYKNHNHPTADDIYSALAPSIPTLSKTTVYNTLKLFVTNGVAIVLNIEGNELRYDADTSVHGHFKCKGCGNLFDIKITTPPDIEGIEGFQVDEYQINLKGYCKICKKTEK